jgi:tagatose 1,6-diphosphate aldolase
MKAKTENIDPGKLRSLQRVTSSDGYFLICALDHLSDFQELLNRDITPVGYQQTGEAKIELVRALAGECTAFLLDARYGLAQTIISGALPGTVGLMASIEDEDYQPSTATRTTRFRDGWGTRQMKLLGVDVCKLLWFYRPDSAVAGHQRDVVRKLVEECAFLSLPLVVEPIWYALEGEDSKSPAWRDRRIEGIIESAREADGLGVDMLKVEFPGYVEDDAAKSKAYESCRALDASVHTPWVILSAGVSYDTFKTQVEIACRAGASGFLAGRSIWRDAASTSDPIKRINAGKTAANRIAELASITRTHGRPYKPQMSGAELVEAFPEFWYSRWQRDRR